MSGDPTEWKTGDAAIDEALFGSFPEVWEIKSMYNYLRMSNAVPNSPAYDNTSESVF